MYVLAVLVASLSAPASEPGLMEIGFRDRQQCLSALETLESSRRAQSYKFISRCEPKKATTVKIQ